jgi:hypothetical protein
LRACSVAIFPEKLALRICRLTVRERTGAIEQELCDFTKSTPASPAAAARAPDSRTFDMRIFTFLAAETSS